MEPKSYHGVDIIEGPGVDEICSVERIVERFGPCAFDVVISTEMIEHVADWRAAISNLKRVAAPQGVILLTTRSKGFPLHDYPADHWRFELDDMRVIFSDCDIERLENDAPHDPGVFVKVRKPSEFQELDLRGYALYSMVSDDRAVTSEDAKRVVAEAIRIRELEERVLQLQEEAAAQAMTLQLISSEAVSASTQLRDMQQLRILRYTAPLRRICASARVALLSRHS
jgi:SAM-dependent methyltransferase